MKQNLEKEDQTICTHPPSQKKGFSELLPQGILKRSTITNKIIYYCAELNKNYCFSSKKKYSEICMGTKTMTCWVTVIDSHLSQHGAIFSATDS